jgi:hypothetical protein
VTTKAEKTTHVAMDIVRGSFAIDPSTHDVHTGSENALKFKKLGDIGSANGDGCVHVLIASCDIERGSRVQ